MFTISPIYAIWLAWLATAVNLVVSKFAVPYITSALFLLLACVVSSLLFLPFLLKSKEWKILLDKKVCIRCLLMSTFGTALPMTVFMIALNYTTPVNASILNQFEIIYSLVLTYILLKEIPTKKQIAGSLLIVCGVGLLLWQAGTRLQLKGDLMIISCLWMYQISHIFAKKLPQDMSAQLIAFSRAFFAIPTLVLLIGGMYLFHLPITFEYAAQNLWITLALCAGINFFWGNTYWYQAIRNMDLSKATAIILSYPVMTFILSVALKQDTISIYKITGMLLALIGAYIVTGIIKTGEQK